MAGLLGDDALQQAATSRFSARPRRDPGGDSVKPARNRVAVADRGRAPGQHQESRLERVIRIMAIVHQRSAEPPHHRPVPLDQDLERRLRIRVITVAISGHEPIEKLAVGQAAQRPSPNKVRVCFQLAFVDVRSMLGAPLDSIQIIPIFYLLIVPAGRPFYVNFLFVTFVNELRRPAAGPSAHGGQWTGDSSGRLEV